jgi:recombination protein RecT
MNEQKQLVPYEELKILVKSEDVQSRFHELLGERTNAFLATVINVVYDNEGLRDADPNSILACAMKAAIVDLTVDPNIGHSWIIPYFNNKKKIKEAQFQIGYKGFVQLALRTGEYAALNATEIYEGEEVIIDRLTGNVILRGSRNGDTVIGYVSYFELKSGFQKFWYMTIEDVTAHAKRYSPSFGHASSPWKTHFDEMAKKTVLKRLLTKYGPMTVNTRALSTAIKEDANGVEEDDPNVNEPGKVVEDREAEAVDEMQALGDAEAMEAADKETVIYQETGEVLSEPPKVTPKKKKKAGKRNEIYDQMVTEGIFQTPQAAKAALRGALTKEGGTADNMTDQEMLLWAQGYRGWIEMGANPKQAALEMNKWNHPV